ncbi:MAG: nucleoside monophosphate kinase [Candidatus Kerfeldbacteria bacterium]|nr:nucleoside monophosphate kinase [Candidatus Kerfeldbacteria bacterium]
MNNRRRVKTRIPTSTRIVLLGPQGSGKGTQAKLLARRLRLPHVSSGDMFREHIKHRTKLGRQVTKRLDAGRLVSDRLTMRMMAERLRRPDCRRGFILDGVPRTLGQAQALARIARPTVVLALDLSEVEAVRRLSGRRMAPDGTIYHLRYNPPPKRLRGQLMMRDDDRPAAVRRRLSEYRRKTRPLLRYYRRAGVLAEIDARPAIKRVFQDLLRVVRKPTRVRR